MNEPKPNQKSNMKNDQEWVAEFSKPNANWINLVRQIQLDALKSAAELCRKEKDGIRQSPIGPLHAAGMATGFDIAESAILSLAQDVEKEGE